MDLNGWQLSHEGRVVSLVDSVPTRSYVVVASAARAEFESHWGPLPSEAIYIQGAVASGHSWSLFDRAGLLDGPTFVHEADQQRHGNSPAERANAWATRSATPGSGRLSGPHIRISEVSHGHEGAPGFVEIYTGGFSDACAVSEPSPEGPCASDADCTGHVDGPACHPFGHFCGVDISDWGVIQSHVGRSRYFATPTIVRAGSRVILTPSGTQAEFEAHWGTSLPSDAVFVTTGGTFPAIDGDETYVVQAPGFVVADGPSPAMVPGSAIQRDDAGWSTGLATPGAAMCPPGLTLSEVADATGPGYQAFEYVELCVGL